MKKKKKPYESEPDYLDFEVALLSCPIIPIAMARRLIDEFVSYHVDVNERWIGECPCGSCKLKLQELKLIAQLAKRIPR
jgi:hypothetical protein